MAERPLWDWGIHFPRDILPLPQLNPEVAKAERHGTTMPAAAPPWRQVLHCRIAMLDCKT